MRILAALILLSFNITMFGQDSTKHMISIKESYLFNDYGVSYTNFFKEKNAIAIDFGVPIFHFNKKFEEQKGIHIKVNFEYQFKQQRNYSFIQFGLGTRYVNIEGLNLPNQSTEIRDKNELFVFVNINYGYSINFKRLNMSLNLGLLPGMQQYILYNRIFYDVGSDTPTNLEDRLKTRFIIYPNADISIGYRFK